MNTNKIFFSYARSDAADFALWLAGELKTKGFNVWIDQLDIPAGTEWDMEIQKALENCDWLLFIESGKSVVSNNVLDEVYYALDQGKKVIPVIYNDSKTPFRLQRLQHVDFTSSHQTGLIQLLRELNRTSAENNYLPPAEKHEQGNERSFIKGRYTIAAAVFCLALIGALLYFFARQQQAASIPRIAEQKNLPAVDSTTITTAAEQPRAGEAITNTQVPSQKKIAERKMKPGKNAAKETVSVAGPLKNPAETYAGEWTLAEVTPKAASKRGYLKITDAGDGRVDIRSSFQFYFFKTNDTAHLVVFNGFASCTSCILKDGLTITDKDIAFGSNRYSILQSDVPGEGKKGDTVMTAGGNSSIKANVSLHLQNNNTVIIKVKQPSATPLSNGITVPPFAYSFHFKNNE